MILSDEVLTVWLCMIANSYENEECAFIPHRVMKQLETKGWMSGPDEPTWDGKIPRGLTPAGQMIVDLNGPECGIETLEEAES